MTNQVDLPQASRLKRTLMLALDDEDNDNEDNNKNNVQTMMLVLDRQMSRRNCGLVLVSSDKRC